MSYLKTGHCFEYLLKNNLKENSEEGGSKGKRQVHLWLIHVDVWQKLTNNSKAIIPQLKKKNKELSLQWKEGDNKDQSGKEK